MIVIVLKIHLKMQTLVLVISYGHWENMQEAGIALLSIYCVHCYGQHNYNSFIIICI